MSSLMSESRSLKVEYAAAIRERLTRRLSRDPANLMTAAGMTPDPWQATLLRSCSPRMALLCSRQAGKSTVAAAMALRAALLEPPSLVLLLSPVQRQSGELFRKVKDLYRTLGCPVPLVGESALTMELGSGSRIVALPGAEGNIRGYSGVSLLVIDEAARVPGALYGAIRPMLAVSGGRIIVLSTPNGRQGWFFKAWQSNEPWERVKIMAEQCPRIPADFLEEERLALGERWFRQEYQCSFEDTTDAVFSYEDIVAAMKSDVAEIPFPEREGVSSP
jgi:hypothetical protein